MVLSRRLSLLVMHGRGLRAAIAMVLLAAVAGCSPSGPPRVSVSGEVTFDGRPVPTGVIHFDPTLQAGRDAPTGFATISDGRYQTEPGQGPGPGPYRARVTGGDGRPVQGIVNLDPEPVPEEALKFGSLLFSDYEVPVELPPTGTTIDFHVPAGAAAR